MMSKRRFAVSLTTISLGFLSAYGQTTEPKAPSTPAVFATPDDGSLTPWIREIVKDEIRQADSNHTDPWAIVTTVVLGVAGLTISAAVISVVSGLRSARLTEKECAITLRRCRNDSAKFKERCINDWRGFLAERRDEWSPLLKNEASIWAEVMIHFYHLRKIISRSAPVPNRDEVNECLIGLQPRPRSFFKPTVKKVKNMFPNDRDIQGNADLILDKLPST